MDNIYVIFDVSEVNLINFEEVLETSADTLRLSINGLKTFVKWKGNVPYCVQNLATKSNYYSHNEMLAILATNEWTVEQIP